jgi:hypothetical protein
VDEVQVVAQYVRAPSGGTFTLTFDDGVAAECPLTTAAIAWNAAAAAIQTAVDTAMTTYLGSTYSPGDIAVTESGSAGISDGTITLTFSGTVVDEKNWITTIIDGPALLV